MAAALGQRDELSGWQQTRLGVLPAHQGLHPDDVAAAQVELGLIVQAEFLAAHSLRQCPGQSDLVDQARVHFVREEAVGVASRFLGTVDGGVGVAEQGVEIIPVGGEEGDADGAGRVEGVLPHLEGLVEGFADGVGQAGNAGQVVRAGQQHHELVAAHAADGGAGGEALAQAFDGQHQHLIAHGIAQAVVDVLEVIQVQVEQRQRALLAAGHGGRVCKAVAQQQAVGQVGERVVMREEVHPGFDLSVLGAGAQGTDAISQVVGQLHQQVELVGVEGVGLAGIQRQGAEHARIADQGQGHARLQRQLGSLGRPGLHARIARDVGHQAGLSRADGRAHHAAAPRRVGPAYVDLCEVAVAIAALGRHGHAAVFVLLGKAHPRQAVAAAFHAEATDLAQQRGLVLGVYQGHVAVAQQAQVAVEALQRALGLLAVADVLHRADDLGGLSCTVEQGFTALVDELHATVRPLQAVSDLAGGVAAHGRLEVAVHAFAVVRVDEGEDGRAGGLETRRVLLENAVDLVRPLQGMCAQVELPVAQLGQALGFEEAGFAAVQLRLGALALGTEVLQLALGVDQAGQQRAFRGILRRAGGREVALADASDLGVHVVDRAPQHAAQHLGRAKQHDHQDETAGDQHATCVQCMALGLGHGLVGPISHQGVNPVDGREDGGFGRQVACIVQHLKGLGMAAVRTRALGIAQGHGLAFDLGESVGVRLGLDEDVELLGWEAGLAHQFDQGDAPVAVRAGGMTIDQHQVPIDPAVALRPRVEAVADVKDALVMLTRLRVLAGHVQAGHAGEVVR